VFPLAHSANAVVGTDVAGRLGPTRERVASERPAMAPAGTLTPYHLPSPMNLGDPKSLIPSRAGDGCHQGDGIRDAGDVRSLLKKRPRRVTRDRESAARAVRFACAKGPHAILQATCGGPAMSMPISLIVPADRSADAANH
jgi:hypothetical protein